MKRMQPKGMTAFSIVWFGQVISLIGSGMTMFALTIWAWEKTGEATALALVGFFAVGPGIIFSPIAGALVDRWNRKFVMMLSDLGAGIGTILMLVLYRFDALEIWHLYIIAAFVGLFQTFQWPAYSAAISVMIPKEQFTRASGMIAMAEWGSGILAPILAGALLGLTDLATIFVIDIVTFSAAILTLLFVFIPNPPKSEEGEKEKGSIWKEAAFGFKYIWQRPSLTGLQLVFFFGNFVAAFFNILSNPTILARTGNNAAILGSAQSIAAIGGVLGSVLITTWGGFKKNKVRGVLLGWFVFGVGVFFFGFGSSLIWWAVCMFLGFFFIPLVNSSNQAIWQEKVPPDLQGRVFSVRRIFAQVVMPLGMLLSGPLADYVFEPAFMAPTEGLPLFFSQWFEPGLGAGMSFMISACGVLVILIAVGGYLFPAVRNVETIIPDFDEVLAAQEGQA